MYILNKTIAVLLLFSLSLHAQSPDTLTNYQYKQWSNGLSSDPSYFPIAVWLQNPSNAAAYKKAGINVYIGLWEGPTEGQLSDLKTAGMKVICDQNATGLKHLNDHTIVGWMHGDEPDNAQENSNGGYDPCIDPDYIIKEYDTIKLNDPSRPVYLNLGQGVSWTNWFGRGTCTGKTEMYPKYIEGTDIVSFDIYPVNETNTTIHNKLWYVPKGIDSLRKWSAYAKPTWCWIESSKINSTSAAQPTALQIKAEIWMALIHGARGIGYFSHTFSPSFDDAQWLHDPEMLKEITAINNTIQSLATVLNTKSLNGTIDVVSSNSTVPIDFMVKEYLAETYIFSVGMRDGVSSGIFSVPSGKIVEVIGEGRNIPIIEGKFTDEFQPFQVHIYKIKSTISTVAAANLHGKNIVAYVDPSDHSLSIHLSSMTTGNAELNILNTLSQKLISSTQAIEQGENYMRLPLDLISPGVYILNIVEGKARYQQKIFIGW